MRSSYITEAAVRFTSVTRMGSVTSRSYFAIAERQKSMKSSGYGVPGTIFFGSNATPHFAEDGLFPTSVTSSRRNPGSGCAPFTVNVPPFAERSSSPEANTLAPKLFRFHFTRPLFAGAPEASSTFTVNTACSPSLYVASSRSDVMSNLSPPAYAAAHAATAKTEEKVLRIIFLYSFRAHFTIPPLLTQLIRPSRA